MEPKAYDMKKLATLIFGFLMVVVGFSVLVKSGISSIVKLFNESKSEKQEIQIVTENIKTLKKIDLTVVNKTDQVFIALPDRPLVPLLISNVKTVGAENFTIDTIRSDSANQIEKISGTSLIYEGTTDEIAKILTVIETVQTYAPLTVVTELDVKDTGDSYKLTMKLSTFWSDLPTELPDSVEPVKDLTPQEMRLLDEITQFRRPGSSNLTPQGPVDRPNPFI